MKKRTAKIIKDSKQRGEWAESVFMARAAENGLPVSKPSGDSSSFDCVVGRPGKFVAVQVKCTMVEMQTEKDTFVQSRRITRLTVRDRSIFWRRMSSPRMHGTSFPRS